MPRKAQSIKELNGPGSRIVDLLGRYHYLTALQANRLLEYRTLKYTQAQLKRLVDGRWCCIDDQLGRPGVWGLKEQGIKYFADQGLVTLPRDSHGCHHSWELFYNHVLKVNDWLIQLELFCRHTPGYELVTVQHDLLLKRLVRKTTPLKGASVPDAFIEVWRNGVSLALWLELDLAGKEEEAAWKNKIRNILAFYDGEHYQRIFGTDHITVAVPVGHNTQSLVLRSHRCEKLRLWTSQVLTELEREDWGEFFLFSDADYETSDPSTYFLSPHWKALFSDSLEALL